MNTPNPETAEALVAISQVSDVVDLALRFGTSLPAGERTAICQAVEDHLRTEAAEQGAALSAAPEPSREQDMGNCITADYAAELANALRRVAAHVPPLITNFNGDLINMSRIPELAAKQIERFACPSEPRPVAGGGE
jgi:hypothetical protein